MSRVMVVAEPGATAEGDKATMLRLLETAHACGADCWKPQWCSDPIAMCERRHITIDHPQRAFYERAYGWLAWPVEWHAEFAERCKKWGMQYACTVFLPQDVESLLPYVAYFKIASFEAGDRTLVASVEATVVPFFRSCGMTAKPECSLLTREFLLHCVSAYPAPLEAMNLSVIRPFSMDDNDEPISNYDGLSDHSHHVLTGAVAVGAGARIIETHYRLDDCNPTNPDYPVAFSPAEFTTYIQNIRLAEQMMGNGVKQVQACERWGLPFRVTG